MKVKDVIKQRNFVAKHAHDMSGAGRHEDKKGKHAQRAKQKQQLRRDIRDDIL